MKRVLRSALIMILSGMFLLTITSSCTKRVSYGGNKGKKKGGATNLNKGASDKTMKKLQHNSHNKHMKH